MIDDYDLIEASFFKQYGIRLRVDILDFAEFLNLCSCLMDDTPLGQMVSIRSEENPEILKNFTPAQHKIRREWRNRQASEQGESEYKASMDQLFSMALA